MGLALLHGGAEHAEKVFHDHSTGIETINGFPSNRPEVLLYYTFEYLPVLIVLVAVMLVVYVVHNMLRSRNNDS